MYGGISCWPETEQKRRTDNLIGGADGDINQGNLSNALFGQRAEETPPTVY